MELKRKYFAIISMVLTLCVIGLFSFNNFNSNKVASKEVLRHDTREFSVETMGTTLAFQSQVLGMSDSKMDAGKTEDLLVNNTNAASPIKVVANKIPAESQKVVDDVNIDQQEDENAAVTEENVDVIEDEVPSTESIMIGEEEFFLVEDQKFAHLINVAEKYEAKLYAIPYSDVFAIVKEDGTPIFHKSTGYAAAKLNEPDILYDVFSNYGDDAEDIANGIQQVIDTGEDVTVEGTYEPYGYAIFQRDDWIAVSW